LVADGHDHCGSGRHGAIKGGVRIFDSHYHPHRAAAQSLGTEVRVFRRLIGHPEVRSPNSKPGYDGAAFGIDSEQFDGSKRGLVELDRFRAKSN
jgi:hypothetical protein